MEGTKDLTLSVVDKDAVGEIANMCMGSAATALSTILGRVVAITTPEVTNSSWKSLCDNEDTRYVCVKVAYSEGISGSNVLLLDEKDALSIANIMIGMDSEELTELELSAMGEVTNQMIGAATTTLSNILNEMVDISPPEVNLIDINNVDEVFESDEYLNGGFIQIKFKLEIEGLVDSHMLQVFPCSFADVFVSKVETEASADSNDEDVAEEATKDNDTGMANDTAGITEANNSAANTVPQQGMQQPLPNQNGEVPPQGVMQQGMIPPNMVPQGAYQVPPNMMPPQGAMPYMYMPYQGMVPPEGGSTNNINVQSAQFNSFTPMNNETNTDIENIDLIMDVPLEVTVELGRTNKSISEILEFKPGTIVELNKVAGDPIDILVNGKLVAIGEVVVIDENFGIRIVDILK